MVTTRAQEASTSNAAGRHPQAERSEGNLHVPPPAPLQADQTGQLNVLTHQVQDLMTAMRGLQEHCLAAMPLPPRLSPSREKNRGISPPPRSRTPPEVSHHSPPRPHHRETSKRRRSLSHHSHHSHRRHGEREPRRAHSAHRRASSSSSSDSPAGGPGKKAARRTEQRLDEYHQRLEELSRRIAVPSGVDYDHRPPLSR